MHRSVVALCAIVILASLAHASPPDRPILATESGLVHGGPADPAAIKADTIQIMGPNRPEATWTYYGDFEDEWDGPDWNGWTSIDLTAVAADEWSVSSYNAENLHGNGAGNLAAWCGRSYPSCGTGDPIGGYGNGWYAWLEYSYEVPDTNAVLNTSLDFWINYDVNSGGGGDDTDRIRVLAFSQADSTGYATLGEFRGAAENEHVALNYRYYPNNFVDNDGDGLNNDVVFWILVETGPTGSDEDCLYPTQGACQIDDLTVTLYGLNTDFDDFETGGLAGSSWHVPTGNAVGDFANLANHLGDLDDCRTNPSYQVNFVDTGFYIDQGLEPQMGLTYVYGPNGYIVQNQGGLTFDPSNSLHNAVRSPIMAWPDQGYDGARLEWTGYVHEELSDVSPGILYEFSVRSTHSDDPADIEFVDFHDDGYAHFGGPGYWNTGWVCSEEIVPGRKWVQIQFAAWQLEYPWGHQGIDGTPAPYFDNVKFKVFTTQGPAISTHEYLLAQDGFPASGMINEDDLSNNSIRFDSAEGNDALLVTVAPLRTDATLVRPPRMYFSLRPNYLYDGLRSNAPANNYVEGYSSGNNEWRFDLPDTHFLYPGDVLHYYFEGVTEVGGQQYTSVLPADTTGFNAFDWPMDYDTEFVWRGLPNMLDAGGGTYWYPPMLLWIDTGKYGGENNGENEWFFALGNIGMAPQSWKCDIFYTHDIWPNSAGGLGNKATVDQLDAYSNILYTSGARTFETLTSASDISLLTDWLALGNKDIFLTGDDLIGDLARGTGDQQAFLSNCLGVELAGDELRPLIDNQSAPLVRVVASQPVFAIVDEWIAFGGCSPYRAPFDAILPGPESINLAEFTDPSGAGGAYPYSAAVLFISPTTGSRAITLPYDLMRIYAPQDKVGAHLVERARVLNDVIVYFGVPFYGDSADIPSSIDVLATSQHPNPFNPVTRIDFNMPRAGHLGIKVYNLRGELVRTLVDEQREAGPGFVVWDGKNAGGAAQASGVYFYEARTDDEVSVGKMTLMK